MSNPLFVMPALQAGYAKPVGALLSSLPPARWMGLRIRGFSPEGVSVLELPVRDDLKFDTEAVDGGLVGIMADYAGVSAAACSRPNIFRAATTGYDIHLLAPAKGETLIAIGRLVHSSKSQAVSRAEVWAKNGDVYAMIAWATTSCRLFEMRQP
jgi:uncharacterized protein (TIGR00369 family)